MKIDHQYYVEDLGSSNGTYVNHELIKKHQKVAVNKNDIIQMADY